MCYRYLSYLSFIFSFSIYDVFQEKEMVTPNDNIGYATFSIPKGSTFKLFIQMVKLGEINIRLECDGKPPVIKPLIEIEDLIYKVQSEAFLSLVANKRANRTYIEPMDGVRNKSWHNRNHVGLTELSSIEKNDDRKRPNNSADGYKRKRARPSGSGK